MEALKDWIQIIMFCVVAIGYLYSLLKKVERPDQDADKRLSKIETICPIQHLSIEEKFGLMHERLMEQGNHFKHIENSMASMDKNIAIILDREMQDRKQQEQQP